jgi:hypothetical protein
MRLGGQRAANDAVPAIAARIGRRGVMLAAVATMIAACRVAGSVEDAARVCFSAA